MEKHVISDAWIIDGHMNVRVPPNTEGDVVRAGSCKDFGVRFKGFEKFVLEVNLCEVEFISTTTN